MIIFANQSIVMQEQIKNSIIRFGLIAGGILAGIFLLTYIFDMNIFSPMMWLLNFIVQLAVVFIIGFIAVSETRKVIPDKTLSFLQAWAVSAGVILFALLIHFTVSALILYVIDMDFTIAKYKELMQQVAQQTNNDPKVMEQMRKGLKSIEETNIVSVLMGLIFPAILTAFSSLIVALAAKKKDRYEDSLNAM